MWLGLSYCSQQGNLMVESYGSDCNYDHSWHKNGQHCVASYMCHFEVFLYRIIILLTCTKENWDSVC
jgi:hypothetical protein